MIGSVAHAINVRFMKRSIVSFEQGSDQICGTVVFSIVRNAIWKKMDTLQNDRKHASFPLFLIFTLLGVARITTKYSAKGESTTGNQIKDNTSCL